MNNFFAETSFCFSLYVKDIHSDKAIALVRPADVNLLISPLVLYEVRQGIRLKMFQHRHNAATGLSRDRGSKALDDFENDVTAGLYHRRGFDFAETLEIAETLSASFTRKHGYRSFDILHVAAAVQMKADRFLTFDAAQKKLAKSVGLKS